MNPDNFKEKFEINLSENLDFSNKKEETVQLSSKQNSNQALENKEKSSSSSPKIQNADNVKKYTELSLESLYAKLNSTNYRDYSLLGYRLTGLGGFSMAMYKKSLQKKKYINNGSSRQENNNKEKQFQLKEEIKVLEKKQQEIITSKQKEQQKITEFNITEQEIKQNEVQIQQIERDVKQNMQQGVVYFEQEKNIENQKDSTEQSTVNSDQVLLTQQQFVLEQEQEQQQFPQQNLIIDESQYKQQKYKISQELIIEEKSKELEDELTDSLKYYGKLSGQQQVQMRKLTSQLKSHFVQQKIKDKTDNSIQESKDDDEKEKMEFEFQPVESVMIQINPEQEEQFLQPQQVQYELKPQLPISTRKVTETRRKITAQILKIPKEQAEIKFDNQTGIPTPPQLNLPSIPKPPPQLPSIPAPPQLGAIPQPPKINIISPESSDVPTPPKINIIASQNSTIPMPPSLNIPQPPSLNIPQPPSLPGIGVPVPPKLIFPNCVSQSIKANVPNTLGVPMPPTLGVPTAPRMPVLYNIDNNYIFRDNSRESSYKKNLE